jgi:hypothetical protein
MIIADFDQHVAFTSDQRQRLLPLAERLASEMGALSSDTPNMEGISLENGMFLMAGSKAKEDELKDILDAPQLRHWQESSKQQPAGNASQVGRMPPAAVGAEPVPEAESEVLENIISDFLCEKLESQRKRALSAMIARAEDAARIAKLTPEKSDRLQTAARGATDQTIGSWTGNLERVIRQNVTGVTSETLKQRLASIPDYQYERRDYFWEGAPILDAAIKAELGDEQQSAWKAEVNARADYHNEAVAALIMAQFDRKVLLTSEQFEKLAPKVTEVVKNYGPDMRQMFSSSERWYLQYYTMFMPLAGVPEKDLKDVLSKEQWDGWSGCNEFSNVVSYWVNIKRNHDNRIKGGNK